MADSRSEQGQALAAALQRVGDRWTLQVVEALLQGPRRFNDLQQEVAGIAPNVLSQRLRRLEQDSLVVARPYSSRPARLSYELTSAGAELAGALRLLAHWGGEDGGAPVRHAACGGSAEIRWYCPTCARTLDDAELDDLRWI